MKFFAIRVFVQSVQEKKSIVLVEKALKLIRAGKMVVLTDDEDRENEGDLVMAAEKVTPAAINFMARFGRGLICLSLTEERAQKLRLPPMVTDNSSPFQTAFTVSIEAARGVTTGISAHDRSHTIRTAVAKGALARDLVRPGHIFPLIARNGGVLVRTGQTEGSVDLARMSGLYAAGVICEIMRADGTMARRKDLLRFARRHRLLMLSVADVVTYRLARERLVRRVASTSVDRGPLGHHTVHAYQSDVDGTVHLAFVKGDLSGAAPVHVRMHRSAVMGDVLDAATGDGTLRAGFENIAKAGRGVLVYLQKKASAEESLQLLAPPSATVVQRGKLHEYGIGAQILRDLGLSRLILFTNAPKRIVALESYGLSIVRQIPLSRPGGRVTPR